MKTRQSKNDRMRKRWQAYRSQGLCGKCGREDDRTRAGLSYCEACWSKRKARHEQYNAAAMRIYYRRKEEGVCVRCGMPRGDSEVLMCEYCRQKMNAAYRRYVKRRKGDQNG